MGTKKLSEVEQASEYSVENLNLITENDGSINRVPASGYAEKILAPYYKKTEIDTLNSGMNAEITKAKNTGTNALTEAQSASAATETLSEQVAAANLLLAGKVDGAYVEDGYLYLTSDNEIVAGPLGPFSGGGGSGGGGGGNNAVLTVTNTSGWLSQTVASDTSCKIALEWSSIEDELPTGSGALTITVNGATKASVTVQQGEVTVELKDYLSAGSNVVKARISDVYGNARTINFSVTVVALTISSTFDASTAQTGEIAFPYVPTGNLQKTVHFVLDGTEIGTASVTASGRQQTYTIPAQSHGSHSLLVYFEAEVSGQTVRSNELYFDLICVTEGDTTPIITSSFHAASVEQYASVAIPYIVYTPNSMTSAVTLAAGGKTEATLTVDRTEQTWTYRADTAGALTLTLTSGGTTKTISLTVDESDIDVEPETNDLALFLSSYGRANTEENPGTWKFGSISAQFSGFNFTSDGWQRDEDNISVLRVSGDARLTIPYKPFAQDFRTTGKTIEIEFATRDIMNYDAVILSCMSGGRGIQLTAQAVTIASEQSSISTQYKEDEHVRISFVVEKRSENRLIYCYINGIISGVVQYPEADDFSQVSPVNITIGTNDCTTDLYCIRIYDNDLTRYQVLENWIADTQNGSLMKERYDHNSVYDAYGQVVIDDLPSDLPYMVLEAPVLPQYKGDKKTISGRYVDPNNPKKSFSFEGAQADVQGTSSQYYARKNYKIKFKGGFTMTATGETAEKFQMRSNSVPASAFTFKADVASSEGANNVELARLYNDICPYQTAPQQEDSRVRQGIDGFPIVMFWDDGTQTTFLGKYNFNDDKGVSEVFGFSTGDESWEIRNNTSNRVLWKSDDYTGSDWLNDFEARYPEDSVNAANLAALAKWLVSTDTTAATNAALSSPVTYGETEYTTDSAAYRLAKFRAELADHCDVDDAIFYYLFTELFLMVDSRAKNAFPTRYQSEPWCWLPYDFDTAIGINNEGALAFDYSLEDIDQTESGADVYNGQQSVMWCNLRAAFPDEIAAMYNTLRSKGGLSYEAVEQQFEDHQGKWPEAIFNEDAYFKYIQPLVENGEGSYLSMCQGSKAEQRKWWLYNRFRYIDSKYNTGDAKSSYINVRAYAISNVTITPYADIYARVQWGSYTASVRAKRNQTYELICNADNLNDTETMIYSADQLKDVGDLSGLMVGYANFAAGTRLQSIKLGDSASTYSNGNLTELYLGNNTLLKTLDVRNCPNLAQTIDLKGCANIEEIYFDGTAITGVELPNGGILKKLHLPGTVTNLTIRNQRAITEFAMPSYGSITTLRLENVSSAVDSLSILESIPANSRVRLIGFSRNVDSAQDVFDFLDYLDTMRGLDEAGNNVDTAQVSGTIHVPSITGAELAEINQRYPDIAVTYDHITSYLYYYNYEGDTLLYTESIQDGGDGAYTGTPSHDSTPANTFTFVGWAKKAYSTTADADARKAVTADRNVYAAYQLTGRTYTVYFYNGSTLLQTVQNVPYGGSASYTGSTPVDPTGEGRDFESWSPAPSNIQGNTSCYAQFASPEPEHTITDTWDEILAHIAAGDYATRYSIGDTMSLNIGSEGYINMQIAAFDADELADGSGKAPITWISQGTLKTKHRMNPSLSGETGNYTEGTGAICGWEKSEMRTYLKETVKPLIPETVRNAIKSVKKYSNSFDTTGTRVQDVETVDDVWIPGHREVNNSTNYDTKGPAYNTLFTDANSRKKIAYGQTSASDWWLRSALSTRSFRCVNGSGLDGSYYANYSYGVALSFCT